MTVTLEHTIIIAINKIFAIKSITYSVYLKWFYKLVWFKWFDIKKVIDSFYTI